VQTGKLFLLRGCAETILNPFDSGFLTGIDLTLPLSIIIIEEFFSLFSPTILYFVEIHPFAMSLYGKISTEESDCDSEEGLLQPKTRESSGSPLCILWIRYGKFAILQILLIMIYSAVFLLLKSHSFDSQNLIYCSRTRSQNLKTLANEDSSRFRCSCLRESSF
jgi:hypothetical protein